MTKYEPLNVSEEIKAIRDRLSQILQLIEEDLALISQPELDEYIRQSRLNLTEIRRVVMRHAPEDAKKAMIERLEEYRRINSPATSYPEPGQTSDQD